MLDGKETVTSPCLSAMLAERRGRGSGEASPALPGDGEALVEIPAEQGGSQGVEADE